MKAPDKNNEVKSPKRILLEQRRKLQAEIVRSIKEGTFNNK